MARNNFPTVQEVDINPGGITEGVRFARSLGAMPKLENPKDPEAVRARIERYFDLCQQNDKRPMVTGICLCLGITRDTLRRWAAEQTPRGEVIRAAKLVIANLLEDWSLTGKLNPATAIFWAKNYLNMSDSITIQAQTAQPLQAERSPEELARLIEEDIPVDDSEG